MTFLTPHQADVYNTATIGSDKKSLLLVREGYAIEFLPVASPLHRRYWSCILSHWLYNEVLESLCQVGQWSNCPLVSIVEKLLNITVVSVAQRYRLCTWERIWFSQSHWTTKYRSTHAVELTLILIYDSEWTPTFANGYLPPEWPLTEDEGNWQTTRSKIIMDTYPGSLMIHAWLRCRHS